MSTTEEEARDLEVHDDDHYAVKPVEVVTDIQDPSLAWNQLAGYDGPSFSYFTPARDAADFYTQAEKNREILGAEMRMLVEQLGALCRKVEGVNWTVLRDLNYEPTN